MSKWGKADFSEFKKLAASFQKALDERVIERVIQELLYEVAYRAEGRIKKRTPVNTGDLRRNGWKVGRVQRQGNSYLIEISNNKEYASFVEYGFRAHWVPGKWEGNVFRYIPGYQPPPGEPGGMQVGPKNGWVEGKFMMTISMKEIERELPRLVERKQVQLIKDIMHGRPAKKGGQ